MGAILGQFSGCITGGLIPPVAGLAVSVAGAPALAFPRKGPQHRTPSPRKAGNEHLARPPPTRPKGSGTSSNLQL